MAAAAAALVYVRGVIGAGWNIGACLLALSPLFVRFLSLLLVFSKRNECHPGLGKEEVC